VTYCIESFDPRVLFWLRCYAPGVIRGQLAQNFLKKGSEGGLPLGLRLLLTGLVGNVLARPDFVAERFSDRRNWSHWMCTRRWGAQGAYWTLTTPDEQVQAERDKHLVIFEGYDASGSWSAA
jgi:hypothetical protein